MHPPSAHNCSPSIALILSGGLTSALKACSFRDETILLTTTLSVLDNALQLYDSIRNLGLAHQIMLTPDNEVC